MSNALDPDRDQHSTVKTVCKDYQQMPLAKLLQTEGPDEMPPNALFAMTKKTFRDNSLEIIACNPSMYKIDCIKFYGKGHWPTKVG